MKTFNAHFTILNGVIEFKNKGYLELNLPRLEGMSGVMTVKGKINKRSLDQNSLYWVWLEEIAGYTGHTAEELHHVYKGLFAPRKTVGLNGKTFAVPKGTSELTVGEMIEFMMHVEAEAAQMGIVLPQPEEYRATLDEAVLIN